ncbi:hypothetical protein [Devosia sp. A449]
MKNVNRKSTSALKYPRSKRNNPIMHLSSCMPGVAHPVAFIPMLREDSLVGQIDATVEMLETKELLMNSVTARFTAWVVPFLAFERFQASREELDRAYMGEGSLDGTGVTAFMENEALPAGGAAAVPLYLSAGEQGKAGDQINTANAEAYNLVYNHRARQASHKLTPRAMADRSLAPAFWSRHQFPHMVADFDQAMMEGQVALHVVSGTALPIHGIGFDAQNMPHWKLPGHQVYGADGVVHEVSGDYPDVWASGSPSATGISLKANAAQGGGVVHPDVWAEMAADGISISLAGLEEAKKLQAFAKLRMQFEGHDDEYIIDMLMQGLSVPDQHLKQPFQIYDSHRMEGGKLRRPVFSQGKRYATDSGNLDDSATSGFTRETIRLRVPQINTGGVVVVLMEILPDQLWERQQDWFFHTRPAGGRAGHDYWPDAERDTLDREKVEVVYNRDMDVSHSDPTGYFAFEPMNAKYNRAPPKIGGKFHRPAADTPTDDARKRLWAVEGVDPALTDSFFIVEPGTMHIKPFLDEINDPFEISARGNCVITGNTQFGGLLIEQTGNYEAVAAHAPKDQIVKEAP